jgi:hypothetical protein
VEFLSSTCSSLCFIEVDTLAGLLGRRKLNFFLPLVFPSFLFPLHWILGFVQHTGKGRVLKAEIFPLSLSLPLFLFYRLKFDNVRTGD